jgi:predicted CopG family antitoxin
MTLRQPGESYSDVILRLIETSAAHLAWSRQIGMI